MMHKSVHPVTGQAQPIAPLHQTSPTARETLSGLSVVVPVYNSRDSLVELCHRLEPVLERLAARYELILVNDGSSDGSWNIVRGLAEQHHWIRGLDLMRNYGQHNALLCGLREAKYDVIVTLDDDLQHPPEEIPILTAKLAEGFDVVYGTPLSHPHSLGRNLASRLTKFALQGTLGAKTASMVSAFRVLRKSVCSAFEQYRNTFVSIDVLLTWGTQRFAAVVVRHDPRRSGVSNYTLGKLLRHALNMMTGYSTLPLQLASMIGFGFTVFGISILLYVVGRYIVQGGSMPGFPFLASIIAIFSGAQLFALGIIGEYLARVHTRTLDRPSYVVRESAENAKSMRDAPGAPTQNDAVRR
jgi:undecaprenyl-phosphate 4-deoxy-4-formamido-L-arabinose transferase